MAALLAMGIARAPRNEADYDRVLSVISHIDRHVLENIRQKDLLSVANMSATKLKALFRQFTGRSITDYIASKRIDHAAHLLSDTELSIEEIASKTGFHTPSSFATFFKKQTGATPSMYRKQMAFYCMKNPSESGIRQYFEFLGC